MQHVQSGLNAIHQFHLKPFPNPHSPVVLGFHTHNKLDPSSFVLYCKQMPSRKASTWLNWVLHIIYSKTSIVSAYPKFCALILHCNRVNSVYTHLSLLSFAPASINLFLTNISEPKLYCSETFFTKWAGPPSLK